MSQAPHFQVLDEGSDPPDIAQMVYLFEDVEEPVRHMRDEALWARIQSRNARIRDVCYRFVEGGLVVLGLLVLINGIALLVHASWRQEAQHLSWTFLLMFVCTTAGLVAAFRIAGPESRATGEYFGRLLSSDVWRRTARESARRGYRS